MRARLGAAAAVRRALRARADAYPRIPRRGAGGAPAPRPAARAPAGRAARCARDGPAPQRATGAGGLERAVPARAHLRRGRALPRRRVDRGRTAAASPAVAARLSGRSARLAARGGRGASCATNNERGGVVNNSSVDAMGPGAPGAGRARPALVSGGRYAAYVLGVLFLVYAVNFIDRNMLSILAQDIKASL